jgi:uncharacterized protein YecE (DUF72 family)
VARTPDEQGTLFALPPRTVPAVPPSARELSLRAHLPAGLRLGAMTWSYPGWRGIVYAQQHTESQLAQAGLGAYAERPLHRAAEIDRAYYEPLPSAVYADYAAQVPGDFRFLVKAHEDCTVARYPLHARYGKKRGLDNPLFLDPAHAAPIVEAARTGLGDKLGAVLFQFPPQDDGAPQAFAHKLHQFLCALPKGVVYAVELRNRSLLTRAYGAALADAGAVHCHNAWSQMPSVLDQARALPRETRRPLVVRWLLRPGADFQASRARYEPFDRVVDEDPGTRAEIARLVGKALDHGVDALVLVDNKAEGSAPGSIVQLGAAVADALPAR